MERSGMKRSALLMATALALAWVVTAQAAGRSAGDVCTSAGFRMGTTSFDLCVARVDGDDPLAGLEQNLDEDRVPSTARAIPAEDVLVVPEPGKPAVAPIKPPMRDGELPNTLGAGFAGNLPGGEVPPATNVPPPPAAPPAAPPAVGGYVAPVPPTPPTPPRTDTFSVAVPAWTWGGQ